MLYKCIEHSLYMIDTYNSVYLWWRYIDDIFFLWEHGEEKLRSFINDINENHPTIKITAEWLKTSINFLDVTVSIAEGIIETDLYVKPTDSHQYHPPVILFTVKKEYPTARH